MPSLTGKVRQPQKKNRTSFKAGQVGANPTGNNQCLRDTQMGREIKSQLMHAATQTDREQMYKVIIEKAKEGSLPHVQFLHDYWISKAAQVQQVEAQITLSQEQIEKEIDKALGLPERFVTSN